MGRARYTTEAGLPCTKSDTGWACCIPSRQVDAEFTLKPSELVAPHEHCRCRSCNGLFEGSSGPQGGCTVPNDGILDTPEASDAANYIYNCNNEQDSCPTSPGLDPVHNYMAYT